MQVFTPSSPNRNPAAARLLSGLLLLALMLAWPLAGHVHAQVPTWAWASNMTAVPIPPTNGTNMAPSRVAVDGSGNSYVLGRVAGAATFGTIALSNPIPSGGFVAKLDAAGNYLWVRGFTATGAANPTGLAVDAAGNVFITGLFAGTMTLGSTTLTAYLPSNQIQGYFVAKLNSAGTWAWANSYGSTVSSSVLPNVALAPGGDVLLAGTFQATSTTGPLAFPLGSTTLVSIGGYDVYVARLDGSTGAWRWAVRGGGTGSDEAQAVCADAAGNVLVAGSFGGTGVFGPASLTANGQDVFVGKLSATGQWQWASGGGGFANDQAYAVAVDRAGDILLAGSFRSQATFGSVQVGSNQVPLDDILVAKLNAAGQWQWATRAGGNSSEYGYAVAADAQNNVYVAGSVSVQADFGSTVLNGTSLVSSVFVGRLSSAGAWQWALGGGNAGAGGANGGGVGFALDAAGNAYLADRYQGTATLGPFALNSGGAFQDGGFVAKLGNTPLASRTAAAAITFSVAPNPAARGAALALHTAAAGTFELRDALGRVVLAAQPVGAGERRISLPDGLPAGLYLATLRTAAGTGTQRLALE